MHQKLDEEVRGGEPAKVTDRELDEEACAGDLPESWLKRRVLGG